MWIQDALAQKAIIWYKKNISPNKGFNCAYRVLHQKGSCSTAVLEIIQNKGLIAGSPHIVRRFVYRLPSISNRSSFQATNRIRLWNFRML